MHTCFVRATAAVASVTITLMAFLSVASLAEPRHAAARQAHAQVITAPAATTVQR